MENPELTEEEIKQINDWVDEDFGMLIALS